MRISNSQFQCDRCSYVRIICNCICLYQIRRHSIRFVMMLLMVGWLSILPFIQLNFVCYSTLLCHHIILGTLYTQLYSVHTVYSVQSHCPLWNRIHRHFCSNNENKFKKKQRKKKSQSENKMKSNQKSKCVCNLCTQIHFVSSLRPTKPQRL